MFNLLDNVLQNSGEELDDDHHAVRKLNEELLAKKLIYGI